MGSCLICQALNELDRQEWFRYSTTTELLVNGETYCTILTPHPDLGTVDGPGAVGASVLGHSRPTSIPASPPRQEAFGPPGSGTQVCK